MSQQQTSAAKANGQIIGGMSGLLFTLTLGLIQWTTLANWDGRGLGFIVYLFVDLVVISTSAWLGGWIAPKLAPPADRSSAYALGILGALAIDALFCTLWAIAGAAEFWHFSTLFQLLGEGVTGILWAGFGAVPAIPWGIVTTLCIRASLQPRKSSNQGVSLE